MPLGKILHRFAFLALLLNMGIACLAVDSSAPATSSPSGTPPATTTASTTPPPRIHITRGAESVDADSGSVSQTQDVDLLGNVVMTAPDGIYTGDAAHYNLLTHLGVIDDVKGSMAIPMSQGRYYFRAAQLMLGVKNVKHLDMPPSPPAPTKHTHITDYWSKSYTSFLTGIITHMILRSKWPGINCSPCPTCTALSPHARIHTPSSDSAKIPSMATMSS